VAAAAPDGPGSCVAATGSGPGTSLGEPTYLDRIVPSVLARLKERKRQLPLEDLQAVVAPKPRSSLAEALRAPGVSLIAEVKRASPSKGPIRPGLEAGPLAEAYEEAGARAVSVLTEEEHFSGSPDDLRSAAAATRLPLLRKDFIFDKYQLYEAHAWGADAVLLIAALLPDDVLHCLARLALDLGLDVLLEVHDRSEMIRALAVEGVIVGVNNRDLRTFAIDLETTPRLAGLVPPERLLVSESGIRTHADVLRLAAYGVDGVLVGESLLRNPDVGVAVRQLMNPVPAVARRPIVNAKKKEAR
jgi:indole-3-glycerol phosphate synthase